MVIDTHLSRPRHRASRVLTVCLAAHFAACASDDEAVRPNPPVASAPREEAKLDSEEAKLDDTDRALLVRLLLQGRELRSKEESELEDAVQERVHARSDALPLDASASDRALAMRVVHQENLRFLVEEDVSATVRYAQAMANRIPARPVTAPLTEHEAEWLVRRRADALGKDNPLFNSRNLEALDLAVLAERAVSVERARVKSSAGHPPTRREIAAALLRHPATNSARHIIDLQAEVGDRCALAVRDGQTFLKALYVGQSAHFGEHEA